MSLFRTATRSFSGRVANFNAGPASLPLPVLQQAQADLVNWKGCGMGVMEMSHRSKEYDSIHVKATADLKELLKVPDNYKIMFIQGGASTQFGAVPLNIQGTGDYLVTGSWSKGAAAEAKRLSTANVAATSAGNKFTKIPDRSEWNLSEGATHFVYCDNETVQGVEFQAPPDAGDRVLVADMSSNFISKPVDVSKYGVIYAGAQKNVGPAGVTIVIARDDLIGKAFPHCPKMMDWKTMADSDSLSNTPPCFAIYMAGLVFDYNLRLGGMDVIAANNKAKAGLLYSTIENSGFFTSPVDPSCRSLMNVPFRVGHGGGDEAIEKKFVAEATAAGMEGLKGHRSVGGIRASIYNAVGMEEVTKLTDFMKAFELSNK
jgi:phosphoserine aminotransferase